MMDDQGFNQSQPFPYHCGEYLDAVCNRYYPFPGEDQIFLSTAPTQLINEIDGAKNPEISDAKVVNVSNKLVITEKDLRTQNRSRRLDGKAKPDTGSDQRNILMLAIMHLHPKKGDETRAALKLLVTGGRNGKHTRTERHIRGLLNEALDAARQEDTEQQGEIQPKWQEFVKVLKFIRDNKEEMEQLMKCPKPGNHKAESRFTNKLRSLEVLVNCLANHF